MFFNHKPDPRQVRHSINLQAFPANAVALRANKPDPVLIKRGTPPINLSPSRKIPEASAIEEQG